MDINKLKLEITAIAEGIKYNTVDENGEEITLTYEQMTPQQLADAYCDADEQDDEIGKNKYWAALLLRYWYQIYKWYQMPRTLGETFEDLFDWLNQSLEGPLYYRSWRPIRKVEIKEAGTKKSLGYKWIENPQYKSALEKNAIDEFTADRSIHYFLGAQRGRIYQEANKQKRRGNYQTMSIDSSYDEKGYCVLDRMGLTSGDEESNVSYVIQDLYDSGKEMEALMVDFIAYGDSQKVTSKKAVRTVLDENGEGVEEEFNYKSNEFSPRRIVAEIRNLQKENRVEQFIAQFLANYDLNTTTTLVDKVTNANSNKLYKAIETTLAILKERPDLIELLQRARH